MAYDYASQNEHTRAFVANLSRNFTPDQAVLLDALAESKNHASGDHYTFCAMVPDELREKIQPITEALRQLDPTLILNEPELYHLTVFWCPLANDPQRLIEIIREVVATTPLSFELRGLFAAPAGMCLKAYPTNNAFFALRQSLYAATGATLPLNPDGSYHERAVSTWITLARYTNVPAPETITFVNERLDLVIGEYTPSEIGAYLSHNKYLKDPEVIGMIRNG